MRPSWALVGGTTRQGSRWSGIGVRAVRRVEDAPERGAWLTERGAVGRLRPDVEQLLADPGTLAAAARLLLDLHFTPGLSVMICDQAGLDLAVLELAASTGVVMARRSVRRAGFANADRPQAGPARRGARPHQLAWPAGLQGSRCPRRVAPAIPIAGPRPSVIDDNDRGNPARQLVTVGSEPGVRCNGEAPGQGRIRGGQWAGGPHPDTACWQAWC
jgi:hypothetical protein